MRVLVATIPILLFIVRVECQHKSFAETTFDLDPNLPAEDVAAVAPPQTEPPAPATTPEPVTTPAPVTIIPTTPAVTVAPIAPIALGPAVASLPSSETGAGASLGSSNPSLPQAPIILRSKLDRFRNPNKPHKRWFRRKFDLSGCPKNEGFIGQEFKKKFPSLLSRGGTDEELSGLVTTRLVACRRKKVAKHWEVTQKMLDKHGKSIDEELSPSQSLACRNGLIEEEVACHNLDSYLCQFIAPSFSFKIVPVRQIVVEARLAESGANKCRQIVELLLRKRPVNRKN
uniref:Uncharacterized protein n=1 Tax=Plectus sambesii TaxID=2011161 RepID=A0A914W2F2_9BILA